MRIGEGMVVGFEVEVEYLEMKQVKGYRWVEEKAERSNE